MHRAAAAAGVRVTHSPLSDRRLTLFSQLLGFSVTLSRSQCEAETVPTYLLLPAVRSMHSLLTGQRRPFGCVPRLVSSPHLAFVRLCADC